MAAKKFTITVLRDQYTMAQYTGDMDALKADLATYLSGELAVYQASDGTSALVIYENAFLIQVGVSQWVGFNFNQWQLYNDEDAQGTTNGGLTPVPDQS